MTLKRLNSPICTIYNETKSRYLEDYLKQGHICLRENDIGGATFELDNTESVYPDEITGNDLLRIGIGETVGEANAAYTFHGRLRVPSSSLKKNNNTVVLQLQHTGLSLANMLVAAEYGAQSRNSGLDTLYEILTDTDNGIFPAYISHILNGPLSTWYDKNLVTHLDEHVANPDSVINWVKFAYKPADKSINELIDLISAIRYPYAGLHWIVDNYGYFRLKFLDTSQDGAAGTNAPNWTLFYGGEDNANGQATITLSEDNDEVSYEELKGEASAVMAYGTIRIPASGDAWTEPAAVASWGKSANGLVASDTGTYGVGTASIKLYPNNATTAYRNFHYPIGKNADWDFVHLEERNHIPCLIFKFRRYLAANAQVRLKLFTDDTHNCIFQFAANEYLPLENLSQFYDFKIPIGPNWNKYQQQGTDYKWEADGASDINWEHVNWLEYYFTTSASNQFCNVDGLCFGDVPRCRVAYDSSAPMTLCKFITDINPCDDAILGSDDSGTLAQIAKTELLRENTTVYCPKITVPIIPDALPGQQFSFNDTTYRATQIDHNIIGTNMTTTLTLTSDLYNGITRPRYDDVNRKISNMRPNTQDRNATNMSRQNIDIDVTQIWKDYAP